MTLPAWAAFDQQTSDESLVSFEDMPRSRPNRLDWEMLDQWVTPQDQVFNVQHYGMPEVDPNTFSLTIDGMVGKPAQYAMEDLRGMPKKDQWMTLECSGNGSSKGFMDAIYNSKWTGTPLAPLLEQCQPDRRSPKWFFMARIPRRKLTTRHQSGAQDRGSFWEKYDPGGCHATSPASGLRPQRHPHGTSQRSTPAPHRSGLLWDLPM